MNNTSQFDQKINEFLPAVAALGRTAVKAAALKAADKLEALKKKKNKKKLNSEMNDAEEVEIMEPSVNVRDYIENDYISLKNGGEGHILKIIYVVMDDNEEVLFLKKCDLGNHTQRDI